MNLLQELINITDEERATQNAIILEQHSRDESFHKPALPDYVVLPKTKEEVSLILKLANEHKIPVIPFGVGSSLEGHIIPYEGGISLDFSLMNRVIEINAEDFLVTVQPGVTRLKLNKELKKYGLFFPVDPGADATIGGMAATNASGTTSVRYGIMRDQVRDLEVVMADGKIIRTGGKAAKSSSGLHLNGIFVGSEGTLGCFTEITLKVYGIPEHKMTARAVFQTAKEAVDASVMLKKAGIPIARCEFVDARAVKQVNHYNNMHYLEHPTLFLEFNGNEVGLKHDIEFASELIKDAGSFDFVFETDSKAIHQLWEVRHNLVFSFLHSYPGKKHMATDVCLPISQLADAMEHARQVIDKIGLDGAVFGHVGDGNFHCLLMIDPTNQDDIDKATEINKLVVDFALARGGTCTGEHGVGVGKKKYQALEHGEAYILMKGFKDMVDPNGILNPGKIF